VIEMTSAMEPLPLAAPYANGGAGETISIERTLSGSANSTTRDG